MEDFVSKGERKIRAQITVAGIVLLVVAAIWIFVLAHPMH
jgi:hypothetical protein